MSREATDSVARRFSSAAVVIELVFAELITVLE